jgi:hypothetical protein
MVRTIPTTLPNGAKVLRFKDGRTCDGAPVVLCEWGTHGYVVWRLDENGNSFSGDYSDNMTTATQRFEERW